VARVHRDGLLVSNHPDTCLLDDHDGWIQCHHGYRWRGAEGRVCSPCQDGDCDTPDRCRPEDNHHTMPHKGCILR